MARHSSSLAWKIPWTEEPGRLQGSQPGVAKSRTRLRDFTFMHWRRKWQPTPVFLPGGSQGQGAWWAAVYGVAQSRTRLKRLSSSSKVTRLINWWCWNLTTDYFESRLNGTFSYYTGTLKRWSTASTTGLHGASGWKSRHSYIPHPGSESPMD